MVAIREASFTGLTARKIFLFFVHFLIMERSKHGVFCMGLFWFTLGMESGHGITGEPCFFRLGLQWGLRAD
jgi:hypothetical protein